MINQTREIISEIFSCYIVFCFKLTSVNNVIFWNLISDIRILVNSSGKRALESLQITKAHTNFQIAKAEESLNLSSLIQEELPFLANKRYILRYFSKDNVEFSRRDQQTINLCMLLT